DQVREFPGPAVDLDEVGAFDLAQVGSAAAFVDPQQRLQLFHGTLVNVEIVRQELADTRSLAGRIDRVGMSCLEKQLVCLGTRFPVAAEVGPQVALQRQGKLPEAGPFAKPAQSQVNEQVLLSPPGDG